ncbi:39S ribosomal protein L47, mitochondrial [Vitis vinifera]|uniref:Large ribosomal subunit protein uL29m n=1 Tax=Vitis vinifera TaxID=29760 RepID=A0A438EYQ4_VITVI|nr:39S ribosomal protein L47, mitochondrial [Vitis vinifera]
MAMKARMMPSDTCFKTSCFFNLITFSGRGWKASELRLKSWDDLHKLWYILLKEKNMLMTQRQMLQSQNLRFPNPERIPKVKAP